MLEHFADTAERRTGDAADVPDTAALRAAHEAFLAQARAGGFAAPADGGWTAEQVVAHVALTAAGLAVTCRALLDDEPAVFDNAAVEDRAHLDALVAASGDLAALVEVAARSTDEFVLLVERLSAEHLATEVPVRVRDGDALVVDEPVPWGRFAVDAGAARHLPGHTGQLRALRR